jgi:hypothetical protein
MPDMAKVPLSVCGLILSKFPGISLWITTDPVNDIALMNCTADLYALLKTTDVLRATMKTGFGIPASA